VVRGLPKIRWLPLLNQLFSLRTGAPGRGAMRANTKQNSREEKALTEKDAQAESQPSPSESASLTSPRCRWLTSPEEELCPNCRTRFSEWKPLSQAAMARIQQRAIIGTQTCPRCQASIPRDVKYCTSCGAKATFAEAACDQSLANSGRSDNSSRGTCTVLANLCPLLALRGGILVRETS